MSRVFLPPLAGAYSKTHNGCRKHHRKYRLHCCVLSPERCVQHEKLKHEGKGRTTNGLRTCAHASTGRTSLLWKIHFPVHTIPSSCEPRCPCSFFLFCETFLGTLKQKVTNTNNDYSISHAKQPWLLHGLGGWHMCTARTSMTRAEWCATRIIVRPHETER